MKRRLLTLTLALLMFVSAASAAIINVPADQPTIQAGIDAASLFDTVLVAPGTYFENIDFHGQLIVLTSYFMYDRDPQYIFNTIIDGSTPADPDTGSVVRMIHNELPGTTLQGFTITHGTGTVWPDEHGAGTFREGGGMIVQAAFPTIQYNYFYDNAAIQVDAGLVSAGGGAMRFGDCSPVIRNNIIFNNHGRYGAGITLNFCGGTIKNNLIIHNIGGEDYGGSGIWKYGNGSPAQIINNTIVGNVSALDGGGVYIWSTSAVLVNNILWGNYASSGPEIKTSAGSVTATYNLVQGGFTGTGNLDATPKFSRENFYLAPSSPGIDLGNPDSSYYDPENSSSPGNAQWPSNGALACDMGAYGGPGAFAFDRAVIFADTTWGIVPFTTVFTGRSSLPIDEWLWDFGDGMTGSAQTLSHLYQLPGEHDVVLKAISGTDTLAVNEAALMQLAADTMFADTNGVAPGSTVEIPISVTNYLPVRDIRIPVEYGGPLGLTFDSLSLAGCRTDYFEVVQYLNFDGFSKRFALSLRPSNTAGAQPDLSPGSGSVARLFFTVASDGTPGDASPILIDGYASFLPELRYTFFNNNPVVLSGQVFVSTCCIGIRGNIDHDSGEGIDIADLIFLVDYSFNSGAAPYCDEESDVNGDSAIDIGDVVYLADFMFSSGPDPVSCP